MLNIVSTAQVSRLIGIHITPEKVAVRRVEESEKDVQKIRYVPNLSRGSLS